MNVYTLYLQSVKESKHNGRCTRRKDAAIE